MQNEATAGRDFVGWAWLTTHHFRAGVDEWWAVPTLH
jgi:hypothetical protein